LPWVGTTSSNGPLSCLLKLLLLPSHFNTGLPASMLLSGSLCSGSPSSSSTFSVPSVTLKKSVSVGRIFHCSRFVLMCFHHSLVVLPQAHGHRHLLDCRYRLCLWRWTFRFPIRQLRRWTILPKPGCLCFRLQGYLPSVRHRRFLFRWYRARRVGRFRDPQPSKDHAFRRQADFLAVSWRTDRVSALAYRTDEPPFCLFLESP